MNTDTATKSDAQRYRDERDALRNRLDEAEKRIASLELTVQLRDETIKQLRVDRNMLRLLP